MDVITQLAVDTQNWMNSLSESQQRGLKKFEHRMNLSDIRFSNLKVKPIMPANALGLFSSLESRVL